MHPCDPFYPVELNKVETLGDKGWGKEGRKPKKEMLLAGNRIPLMKGCKVKRERIGEKKIFK